MDRIQWRQTISNIVRVQCPSLPLPSPLLSSILLFPTFPSPLFSLPSQSRFCCILRVKERCWWYSRCTVSNNRARLFLTFLWRNFPKANYCFHSVVTLLWGSKHRGPSQLIYCESPDLRTLTGSTPMITQFDLQTLRTCLRLVAFTRGRHCCV